MKFYSVPFISKLLPVFFILMTLVLVGCDTTTAPTEDDISKAERDVAHFHIGDTVTVTFDGLPTELLPHEETIKEDGTITLNDIGPIQAAGKTAGQLQKDIHDRYVPQIYTHLNVTVKSGDRVYYVRGEVGHPDRILYTGPITVTKAIASAGDFNDFANRKNIVLTRANGERIKVNCDKVLDGEAPDPQVYPGDLIEVRKRLF
jgi:protein involved in polysaccharide export with SLBB domain